MKKLALLLALMLSAVVVKADPYLYTPFSKGYKFNYSNGALFDSHFANAIDFNNLALIYHPMSSGSIIPGWLQPYVPPMSWAINCGGGAGNGYSQAGCGPAINVLDTVRAYASELLQKSSNPTWQAAGQQIAPGNGPLNLLISYEPTSRFIYNGQFARNPMKFTNHWFIGPSYSF